MTVDLRWTQWKTGEVTSCMLLMMGFGLPKYNWKLQLIGRERLGSFMLVSHDEEI